MARVTGQALHRDQLGSVRAVTTFKPLVTGAAVSTLRREAAIYKPFGEQTEVLQPTQVNPEQKGWIGQRYDADAGLQYLNARYYDPEYGFFLQPDWFEVTAPGVGTNRSSYAKNDPVNRLDPGGNQDAPDMTVVCIENDCEARGAGGMGYLDQMRNVASAGAGMAAEVLLPDFEELLNNDLTVWDAIEVASVLPVGKAVGYGVDAAKAVYRSSRLTGGIKVVNEAMSSKARAYQSRVTGMDPGTAYVQNGVRFDGVETGTGTLVDAKFGMDFMVDVAGGGGFKSWARAPNKLIEQASRQVSAANGARVEWRFSSAPVANTMNDFFKERGIGIAVVHVE